MNCQELDSHLASFSEAPKDGNAVTFICIRPKPGMRQVLDRVTLCPDEGVIGDRWKTSAWLRCPNGDPDPRVQVSLCSSRLLALLQNTSDPKRVIGDNFVVDFDFSEANLPVGQRLVIGKAIIEVSDVYNDACVKFAQRFGTSVLNWVREPQNRSLRLRGIFARVIRGGEVRLKDYISKC